MKFINSIAKNNLVIFDEKIEIRERCKGVHCVELSNKYLLAKIGVDTAENDPCNYFQKVCKILQDLLAKFLATCKPRKICKILQDLQFFKCFLQLCKILQTLQLLAVDPFSKIHSKRAIY